GDHADLVAREDLAELRVGLVQVDRLVLDRHVAQQGERLDARLRVEGRLRAGLVEDLATVLPQVRPELPRRLLRAGDRVAVAVRRRRGVGELLGGRAEVVPRPVLGGVLDAGAVEDRLVVDERDVVDHGGEADGRLAGRLRRGTRGPGELLPADGRVGHLVGDVQRPAGVGELARPRAERVGDVRV